MSKSVLGICYRPPDSPDTFLTNLHDNIAEIRSKFPKANMHLFGDFNYPEIDWINLRSSSRNCRDFINLTLDFSFAQLVDIPTRDQNILDLVLTSAPETVGVIGCIDGFSDHRLLELTIEIPSTTRHAKPKNILNYKKADFRAINKGLKSFSEAFLKTFSHRSVSENWIAYKEKLTELTHAHIPRTRLRVNVSKPWFHRSLLTLKNKKKRLFKIAKRTGTEASRKKTQGFRKGIL